LNNSLVFRKRLRLAIPLHIPEKVKILSESAKVNFGEGSRSSDPTIDVKIFGGESYKVYLS